MTNKQIKKRKEILFKRIKKANTALTKLRKNCPHEKTSIVNYEWRTGSIIKAKVCDYCGEFIKRI